MKTKNIKIIMKKTLIFLSLTFLSFITFGQQMELTDKGFINKNDDTKDYIVIDVPNTSKEKLYQNVKKYINTLYNNPKLVSSEIENEQIVIDAVDGKEMTVIFRLNGSNLWSLNYKYDFQFKDNKIRFSPTFKSLSNPDDSQKISLIGSSFMGNATGIFNSKGKVLKEKAKINIETIVNNYIEKLKLEMTNPTSTLNKDW